KRASCVVNVDHGAGIPQQRGRNGVRNHGWQFFTLPDRRCDANDGAVDLVRDIENMLVGDPAFDRIAVEQAPGRMTPQDERELPCEIIAVMETRVETLPGERTREVGGVAD